MCMCVCVCACARVCVYLDVMEFFLHQECEAAWKNCSTSSVVSACDVGENRIKDLNTGQHHHKSFIQQSCHNVVFS